MESRCYCRDSNLILGSRLNLSHPNQKNHHHNQILIQKDQCYSSKK